MRRIPSFTAALLAASLLALLPACGFSRYSHAVQAESGPIEKPHIVRRVAPRDAGLPAHIERGAGEYYGPDAEASWLAGLLLQCVGESGRVVIALTVVAVLGIFGLIWLLVELAKLGESDGTNKWEAEQAEIAEKLRLARKQK